MATVKPSLDRPARFSAGLYRELEVIRELQRTLPQGYEIFHNVFIHNADENGGRKDGRCEIDAVVMAPSGSLLLMEIKAGGVEIRDGKMYKTYDGKLHDVDRQCANQYGSMIRRLNAAGLRAELASCLVLPDHRLEAAQIVSMPREPIIDASAYRYLGERVRQLLSTSRPGHANSEPEAIRNFLNNVFEVVPDLAVLGQQLASTTRQMADGLASWVPRITAPSGVVRVQATAGSGKTQLALRLLGDAVARGQSALYVCFNRSLADHMICLASPKASIGSFHELAMAHYRRHHGEPDFTDPQAFSLAAQIYVEDSAQFTPRYDLLLIDEAQDFDHAWLQALRALLRPESVLYVLEDEQQQLYGRDPVEIANAVLVQSNENYRSPRAVCDVINALGLTKSAILSRSPFPGELPALMVCDDEAGMRTLTEKAVADFLTQGFQLDEIAVLSAHGRKRSRLLNVDHLGSYEVRRFTGNYDAQGNACWTAGELLVESIYRFKGQSARAVVLTEIDFDEIDAREKAVLFVGMTRTTMALTMVLSVQAEAALAQRIQQDPG